MERNR